MPPTGLPNSWQKIPADHSKKMKLKKRILPMKIGKSLFTNARNILNASGKKKPSKK